MSNTLLLGLIERQTDVLIAIGDATDNVNFFVAQLVKRVVRVSRQIHQLALIKHVDVRLCMEVGRPVLTICLLQTVFQYCAFLNARNLQVARYRGLFINAADVFKLTRHRPLLAVFHEAAKLAVEDHLRASLAFLLEIGLLYRINVRFRLGLPRERHRLPLLV